MKHTKSRFPQQLFFLSIILILLSASNAFGKGLQDFIDEPKESENATVTTTKTVEQQPLPTNQADTAIETSQKNTSEKQTPQEPVQALTNKTSTSSVEFLNSSSLELIELIVFGIVAAALIIALLILSLGRFINTREHKVLKELKKTAEEDVNHLHSATANIKDKEKKTLDIYNSIKQQSLEITKAQLDASTYQKELENSIAHASLQNEKLNEMSISISKKTDNLQSYWDTQLKDTLNSITEVQSALSDNLKTITDDTNIIKEQKETSDKFLNEMIGHHNKQSQVFNDHQEISNQIETNLAQTLEDAKQLNDTIQRNQVKVDNTLNQFNDSVNDYQKQAYELFDSSFQVADLARKELNENISESRKHLESMRRHEAQSHKLNQQSQKNLEALDFKKIAKLSISLTDTQDAFSELQSSFSEAKEMLALMKSSDEKSSEINNKDLDNQNISTESMPDTNKGKFDEVENNEASEKDSVEDEFPTVSFIANRIK